MSVTNRRKFLISSAPVLAAPLLLPMLTGDVSAADIQAGWRFCSKCNGLFWGGGGSDKAPCSAGGVRNRMGYIFHLPHSVPGTPTAQSNWRFCDKCFGLFWNGYPDKGRCAAGVAHRVFGFDYVIPHSIAPNATHQDSWRYCGKCKAMFYFDYKPYAIKFGICSAGGGHEAAGYKFVLAHDLKTPDPPTLSEFRVRVDLHTDGWAPIRGWTEITAKPNGDYSFAGHIHNSGAVNIRFTLGAVLVSPEGRQCGFAVSNKRVDGTEVLIGRNRNYDWGQSANSPEIAYRWADFSRSVLGTRLVASSAVGSGLTNMLKNVVYEIYPRIPNPYATREVFIGLPLSMLLSL